LTSAGLTELDNINATGGELQAPSVRDSITAIGILTCETLAAILCMSTSLMALRLVMRAYKLRTCNKRQDKPFGGVPGKPT
jgi:hypothetical protein